MDLYVREFIFLGTGTSSCVPNVRCLVNTKLRCETCFDAASSPRSPNRRRNTSILVRASSKVDPSIMLNILIDAGKSFYESSVQWFPENNVSTIDAVILTHPHADAMLGLDDLRAWCVDGRSIPVFVHEDTMGTIASTFPYCVNPLLATGGGQVPSLDFKIFTDATESIDVCGINFVPLKVQHGFTPEDCSYLPEITVNKMNGCDIIILDSLRSSRHTSHFSLIEAMEALIHLNPRMAILTGFTHELSHSQLEILAKIYLEFGPDLEAISASSYPENSKDLICKFLEIHMSTGGSGFRIEGYSKTCQRSANPPSQIIPAHDGLKIILKNRE